MPTILRSGPYRFFFYSNEGMEPPHIHIQRERSVAKFWLKPVSLASATRFAPQDIRDMRKLVETHKLKLLEAWDGYFNK